MIAMQTNPIKKPSPAKANQEYNTPEAIRKPSCIPPFDAPIIKKNTYPNRKTTISATNKIVSILSIPILECFNHDKDTFVWKEFLVLLALQAKKDWLALHLAQG